MATTQFFDESQEQSTVKATIVEHYFSAWAQIIIAAQKRFPNKEQRIGYIDLFAGPGQYKDGSISTPLRILKEALENQDLRERLVTVLNDKDKKHSSSLIETISSLENISSLKYQPKVWNEEVGDNIAKIFKSVSMIPILAFIDPWGYKGLSLKLIDGFLKNWGCDCIFFFNYNRINAGLSNPLVIEHMRALFGDVADELSKKLKGLTPFERETTIVENLAQALKEKESGDRFVLPFCFKNDFGARTTHHLIFVSKSFKGYEVMKEIMAKQSSSHDQGVPSFQFCPAVGPKQKLLFELSRPLDDLEELLLKEFAGKSISMADIYKQHCVDTPYIKSNYKKLLKKMEGMGSITTSGRKSNRGFADTTLVKFPKSVNWSP